MLDWDGSELSIKTQAELLNLNRSSLYYRPVEPLPQRNSLSKIESMRYTQNALFMDQDASQKPLNKKDSLLNRKAVQWELRGYHPVQILSKQKQQHRIYPYLLRGLTIQHPNHVWGIDITYVRLKRSWLYLVALIDWYSRYVISWELDQKMDFVITCAFSRETSHFTSPKYINLLKQNEVHISMDGKGRALDNTITERLWCTIKYEEIYLKEYHNPREARQEIRNYFCIL
ncbi:putative transposase [Virgibacillus pantothenticus]|nr:putative transposase [Virgibacillus pantothenticus]